MENSNTGNTDCSYFVDNVHYASLQFTLSKINQDGSHNLLMFFYKEIKLSIYFLLFFIKLMSVKLLDIINSVN